MCGTRPELSPARLQEAILLLNDRWKDWKEAFLVELDAADVWFSQTFDLMIILFIGGVFSLTIC